MVAAENAALSLCGVQLLGAAELALSQHMLSQAVAAADGLSAALQATPAALRPDATSPIDGDSRSCLAATTAANISTSWQLRLDGSYPVLGVRVTATPPAAAAAAGGPAAANATAAKGGAVAVSLLDAADAVVTFWRVPTTATAGGGAEAGSVTLESPAAVFAAAVRVEGFASLCELQLLTAALRAAPSYPLSPLPELNATGRPQGQWLVLDGATGMPVGEVGVGSSSSNSSGALFDGDPATCVTVQPLLVPGTNATAQQAAALEVQLDRPIR